MTKEISGKFKWCLPHEDWRSNYHFDILCPDGSTIAVYASGSARRYFESAHVEVGDFFRFKIPCEHCHIEELFPYIEVFEATEILEHLAAPEARKLLKEIADKLTADDQTFCLMLKTGDSYLIYDRCPDDGGSFHTYLPNVTRFEANFDANAMPNHTLHTCRRDMPHFFLSGKVKTLSGCTLMLNDGVADWEIECSEDTNEYLRGNIKVGDYLKLKVTRFDRPISYGDNSAIRTIPKHFIIFKDGILRHTRHIEYDQVLKG